MSLPDRLLGARVVAVSDLTRPWSTAVRTSLLTLDDGRRVIHQVGASTRDGRDGIGRRIRFARALRRVAPDLPVPEVLDGDAKADPPSLVTRYVEGIPGDRVLADPAGAAIAAMAAGRVATALGEVPPRALGIGLPGTWGAPGSLDRAARRWLRDAGLSPAPETVASVRAAIDRIPGRFDAPPVVAHGDLVPVNLVLHRGRLAGVLDLERLRVAPAGFDAAWFRLLVRHHHPSAWATAGPALLGALGFADDRETAARLDDLAALACLEVLAGLPRRDPRRGPWTHRLDEALGRTPVP